MRTKHPLVRVVLRRIVLGVSLLAVVSLLVFAATELLPGDAARAALGAKASEAQVQTVRHQLGLDRPLLVRYGEWMGGMLTGNLGTSLIAGDVGLVGATSTRTPVGDLIAEPVRNTLILALVTIVLLVPFSFALGILGGIRPGSAADGLISLLTLAALGVPDFVVGTVLILVFAVTFRLFPPVSLVPPGTNPLASPSALVLPVATLLIVSVGFAARQIRAGVAEAMRADFVQMARLSGIRESRIVIDWALRNSIAPAIQSLTQVVQYLLGGVVLTEYVFGYPGIGAGLVSYVAARDVPVIQAVAVLIAAVYIGLNIVADVLVILVVPKVRTAL